MSRASQFGQEARELLRIGFPVMVSQVLMMSMQFVDTVMSGNVSPNDLAAIATASALFHPIICLVIGVLLAITPIVAQLDGARKWKRIGPSVRQGVGVSLVLLVLSLLVLPNLEPLLEYMEYDPAVIRITDGYLEALCWGLPAAYVFLALKHFLEGLGITRPNMIIHVLGLGANVLGNYTLIFGHFGFPRLGAVGAGWTTTLVHWVMLVALVGYILRSPRLRPLNVLTKWERPRWGYWREILKIGIPSGLSLAAEVGMFAMVALLMGTYGVTALAAHQVAVNVAAITFMIPLGLSAAITSRVGQAAGRRDWDGVRFRGRVGILLSVLIMISTASGFLLFPEAITSLYTQDTEVRLLAVQMLAMAALFQFSDGLQISATGALRGLKDTRIPMISNLLAYWGMGLTLAYGLGFVWETGPVSMWWGLVAGLSTAAALHNLRFYKLTRRLSAPAGPPLAPLPPKPAA